MFQTRFGNEKLRVNGMGSLSKAGGSCRQRNLVYIYDIVLMVFLGRKSTGTVNEITQPSAPPPPFKKKDKKMRIKAIVYFTLKLQF